MLGAVSAVAAPGRDKAAIRAALLSVRRSMPSSVRAEADAALRSSLASLVSGRICAYVPMADEPGGPSLPSVLAALPGVTVLLPVLLPDLDLDWAVFTGDLAPGRFGLREPTGSRLGVSAVADAALVIAPALAVSVSGVRLGRGGGSYDRALARATGPVVVPLYDGEVVDRLPAEPHDQRVDAAVTPSGLLVTGRNRPG